MRPRSCNGQRMSPDWIDRARWRSATIHWPHRASFTFSCHWRSRHTATSGGNRPCLDLHRTGAPPQYSSRDHKTILCAKLIFRIQTRFHSLFVGFGCIFHGRQGFHDFLFDNRPARPADPVQVGIGIPPVRWSPPSRPGRHAIGHLRFHNRDAQYMTTSLPWCR